MNQLIIIKNFYLALHTGAKAIRALRVKCVKIRLNVLDVKMYVTWKSDNINRFSCAIDHAQ